MHLYLLYCPLSAATVLDFWLQKLSLASIFIRHTVVWFDIKCPVFFIWQTLVYSLLEDMFFLSGDRYLAISATMPPIGVEFCVMVELYPGRVFCCFSGDIFRSLGPPNVMSERRPGGPILASQRPIFAIWQRISRKRYMSTRI